MTTKDLIDIYKSYGWDLDGFTRHCKPHQKQMVNDDTWGLIGSVIQDLRLINRGTVSDEYKEVEERKLLEGFDPDAVKEVRLLAME